MLLIVLVVLLVILTSLLLLAHSIREEIEYDEIFKSKLREPINIDLD